ncbi:MAG: phosphoadenylyl-sulfate reductase [Planctomycetes bacterium]|nr:phosphoadenylyl-sulfate reductase [Planctomycetota bacterium]
MLEQLAKSIIAETSGYSAEELLKYAVDKFGGRVALASSFGVEDQVLTDMLCKITGRPKSTLVDGTPKTFTPNAAGPRIFTLDTGRLAQQTYDVMDETRKKYGIKIRALFPDYKQIEEMVTEHGPNLFYESVELRKLCCKYRKIEPLKKELADLDVWICGLRAGQSTTRTELQSVQVDEAFGLIKICPLADWTEQQVWDYIKENDVPYNKLHDEGYPSIGCEPCTRAIEKGEDVRAGRWWWEEPIQKECGLHLKAKDEK